MASNDYLGNGAHADGIAAHPMIHSILGRGFERGALYTYVNAVYHADVFLFDNLVGQLDQPSVLRLVHIGESWPRGEVLSMQRMFGKEVDMIVDDHQVADSEIRIHSTRSVTDEKNFYS